MRRRSGVNRGSWDTLLGGGEAQSSANTRLTRPHNLLTTGPAGWLLSGELCCGSALRAAACALALPTTPVKARLPFLRATGSFARPFACLA